jgi:hypothetical protein
VQRSVTYAAHDRTHIGINWISISVQLSALQRFMLP